MQLPKLTLPAALSVLMLLLSSCFRGGSPSTGDYLTLHLQVPENTSGLEATLSYDPAALEFMGGGSEQAGVLVASGTANGQVKVAAVSFSAKNGRFALASFKVVASGPNPKWFRSRRTAPKAQNCPERSPPSAPANAT